MRRGKNVVTQFAIPNQAPPEVEAAKARFDEAADKWARIKGELDDAEALVGQAKLKDAEAIAAAVQKDGSLPKDPSKHERDAFAKVAGLRKLLEAAATAADEAGNEMLVPIEQAKSDWIAVLEPSVAERLECYEAAIATARSALDELQTAKASVSWLENFDAGEARVYRHTRSFPGKGPRALVEDHKGAKYVAAELLELAARVGEPTAAELYQQRREQEQARKAEAAPQARRGYPRARASA